MAGGRHPMNITYDIGFKSDGKITALHLYILINAGIFADISPVLPSNMLGVLKKYDWGALSFDIKENLWSILCRLSGTNYRYHQVLAKELKRYNSLIKRIYGRKGGFLRFPLCMKSPIVHEVTVRPTPGKVSILSDGSIVVEVGGIELWKGLWTKVKQMTAYALSSIQCDGIENILDKVRIVQEDSLSLIQGRFTVGSTISEASCEAVRICCNILIERLAPLKEKL
ncbi:hypothetical protein AgCh_024756 [Apium graveolens]